MKSHCATQNIQNTENTAAQNFKIFISTTLKKPLVMVQTAILISN